jgi:exodeoxyribonuclease VII small subunit
VVANKKKAGFEQQLQQLEQLVDELESGELELEEGVERYRQGVKLLKTLNGSLSAAEQQVEELTAALQQELAALEQGDDGSDDDHA